MIIPIGCRNHVNFSVGQLTQDDVVGGGGGDGDVGDDGADVKAKNYREGETKSRNKAAVVSN